MRLDIEVLEDDGRQLRALRRWLMRDPDTAGASLSLRDRQERPGTMGGGLELIDVVLSNAVGLGGLLLAVANWRQSRGNGPEVRVEHRGVTVTVSGADPRHIERLVRQLTGPGSGADDGTPDAATPDAVTPDPGLLDRGMLDRPRT
ncbi:effector-associated constant component EACC1 [Streptomyces mirabilis]|uniref:effector-associated constant component EACC1 n=1 Tax=Streptomyces mirabilis TaxID=68239 RepID=UPI00364783B3